MKKRIKNHLLEEVEMPEINQEMNKEDDFYVKLLITDLKKQTKMPKYSLWSEMVDKHILKKEN